MLASISGSFVGRRGPESFGAPSVSGTGDGRWTAGKHKRPDRAGRGDYVRFVWFAVAGVDRRRAGARSGTTARRRPASTRAAPNGDGTQHACAEAPGPPSHPPAPAARLRDRHLQPALDGVAQESVLREDVGRSAPEQAGDRHRRDGGEWVADSQVLRGHRRSRVGQSTIADPRTGAGRQTARHL